MKFFNGYIKLGDSINAEGNFYVETSGIKQSSNNQCSLVFIGTVSLVSDDKSQILQKLSCSDLLSMYEKYGPSMCEKLDGSFSIII